MNKLNRLIVVLFLFLSILVCTASLVVPDSIVQFAERLSKATQTFDMWARVLVAIVLNLVLILLLVSELRRPTSKALVRVRGTDAEISPASIEAQIRQHVREVSDLLDVSVQVKPVARGRVKVELDVLASPDVKVAGKVNEINGVVRTVIKKNLGLSLSGSPVIRVDLASPAAMAHRQEVLSAPSSTPPEPEPKLEPDVMEMAPQPETVEIPALVEAEPEAEEEPEMAESQPQAPTVTTESDSQAVKFEEPWADELEEEIEPEEGYPPVEASEEYEAPVEQDEFDVYAEEDEEDEEALPEPSDLAGTPFADAAASMDDEAVEQLSVEQDTAKEAGLEDEALPEPSDLAGTPFADAAASMDDEGEVEEDEAESEAVADDVIEEAPPEVVEEDDDEDDNSSEKRGWRLFG